MPFSTETKFVSYTKVANKNHSSKAILPARVVAASSQKSAQEFQIVVVDKSNDSLGFEEMIRYLERRMASRMLPGQVEAAR